jgi:hypothetical protein
MEALTHSRAQSPAHSRARHAAGDVRLHAILGALLLSLLAALLGLRRHPRAWHEALAPLPLDHDEAEDAWWITLPESDSARRLEDMLGPDLPLELVRLLYVFGPRQNRGMRARPRTLPTSRTRRARGPPRPPAIPHNRIRATSPPAGGR